MSRFSRKESSDLKEVETPIWKCTEASCPGWMRVEFSFEEQPNCPLCGAEMLQDTKQAPKLSQTFRNY